MQTAETEEALKEVFILYQVLNKIIQKGEIAMFKTFFKSLRKCFLIIVLLFIANLYAHASTIQVPGQYPTIQAALDMATDGDTIQISPGTYVENLNVEGKGVTLIGMGGADMTIIQGATFGSVLETRNYSTPTAITLKGLTITKGQAYFGGGILAFGSAPVVVTDCVFDDNHSTYGYLGAAIVGWNPPMTIERCRFTNNDQQGDRQFLAGVITLVNGSTGIIRNNIFWNNNTRALNLYTATSPTIVENNTIIGNQAGFYMGYGQIDAGIAIRNNIVVNNQYGFETFIAWTYTFTTFENNLVFGNTTNFYNAGVNPMGTNGNLSVAPKLVNEATGDFHLAPDSPAIDAGTSVGAPLDDIEREIRPMDGNGDGLALFDIGAYEAKAIAIFDLCIQDDSSGDLLRINLTTGAYQLTRCRDGFTAGGTGTLSKRGCTISFQDNRSDRRILASIDTCSNRATASVQIFAQGSTFTLTDRNMTNNTCSCPSSN